MTSLLWRHYYDVTIYDVTTMTSLLYDVTTMTLLLWRHYIWRYYYDVTIYDVITMTSLYMTLLLWRHYIWRHYYDVTTMTSLLWRHYYDVTTMTSLLWRHYYDVTTYDVTIYDVTTLAWQYFFYRAVICVANNTLSSLSYPHINYPLSHIPFVYPKLITNVPWNKYLSTYPG